MLAHLYGIFCFQALQKLWDYVTHDPYWGILQIKIPQMLAHLYGIFCFQALTKALLLTGLKAKNPYQLS
jgi:hypothetical protein